MMQIYVQRISPKVTGTLDATQTAPGRTRTYTAATLPRHCTAEVVFGSVVELADPTALLVVEAGAEYGSSGGKSNGGSSSLMSLVPFAISRPMIVLRNISSAAFGWSDGTKCLPTR